MTKWHCQDDLPHVWDTEEHRSVGAASKIDLWVCPELSWHRRKYVFSSKGLRWCWYHMAYPLQSGNFCLWTRFSSCTLYLCDITCPSCPSSSPLTFLFSFSTNLKLPEGMHGPCFLHPGRIQWDLAPRLTLEVLNISWVKIKLLPEKNLEKIPQVFLETTYCRSTT